MLKASEEAKRFAKSFFVDQPITDIRVEEIDREGDHWNVTVSYALKEPLEGPLAPLAQLGTYRTPRSYKIVKVNSSTGHIDSVKMLILS